MQRANDQGDQVEGGSIAKSPWGVAIPISFVSAIFVMLGCGSPFSMAEGKADADGVGDVVTNDAVSDAIDVRLNVTSPESDAGSAFDSALDGVTDTGSGTVTDTGSGTDGSLPCEDGDRQCEGSIYKWCKDGVWKTQSCDLSTHKCDKGRGGCYRDTCKPACSGEQFCRDDDRCSPRVFETEWNVEEGSLSITLPYYEGAKDAKCDFQVLWGDEPDTSDFSWAERITECKEPGVEHKYEEMGVYRVKILGTYIGWGQREAGKVSLKQLTRVVSFGPVGLTQYAFSGVGVVIFVVDDVPDATQLTNAKSMFEAATYSHYYIDKWDVSKTLNMEQMFYNAHSYYPRVSSWTLNPEVKLDNIFEGSAMTSEGVCELITKPVWEENANILGISCRSYSYPLI